LQKGITTAMFCALRIPRHQIAHQDTRDDLNSIMVFSILISHIPPTNSPLELKIIRVSRGIDYSIHFNDGSCNYTLKP